MKSNFQSVMIHCFLVFFSAFLLTINTCFAQKTEQFIPKDAVTVFTLNNISILQKVSMDELVSYDFMTALQSELFDGSTAGKSLKDAGIDFNQKMHIFYGKNKEFELSGFTFGITSREQLFNVFDDFDRLESKIPNAEYYNNYFNHLILRENTGMLIRVDADQTYISELADSIWVARGFELPYVFDFEDNYDEEFETYDNEEIFDEDLQFDNEDQDSTDQSPIAELPNENEQELKLYYAMRDSLETEFSLMHLNRILSEIYVKNINLSTTDLRFTKHLNANSDGIFYLDNSRSFKNNNSLWYFQTMFPEMYADLSELYKGNVILGEMYLNENSIDMKLEAQYGEALGEIYKELNDAKFDKNVMKYIPKSNAGFFTYNINLKKGYEQAYDIIIPILEKESNVRVSANVLMMELINEFVNTDEVFDAYKGSMFGSFNGIKRVKTKRIEFDYDENTFEYSEREIEAEEDMPIFTFGFSTLKPDVPEKILRHFSRITSQFKNMGNYWVIEDAVLNSVPLYVINKNGLLIFTNDEDLAKNHSNGYGAESISKKAMKKAKKSGSVYMFSNFGELISKIPDSFLDNRSFDIIRSMKGKQGVIEVISSETTAQKTNYDIQFSFDQQFNNGGKYLLDLINTAYNISKGN